MYFNLGRLLQTSINISDAGPARDVNTSYKIECYYH